MAVYVANESGTPVDELRLVALARYVLDAMGVAPAAELSVLLIDERAMTDLHVRWMGEDGPTDVLAFPMDELDSRAGQYGDEDGDEPQLLGDVVLCPPVAARQAAQHGHSVEDELHLLATHGMLHLLGFNHDDEETEQEMFARQTELLVGWRARPRGESALL